MIKEKENLVYLVNMAENEEWEAQDVIEEDDEHFNPLLDNVDMVTLMEKDVNSQLGSQNGLPGVDVEDPSLKKKELRRWERPGTPGEAHSSGYSWHKQTVSITTVYGLTYYGRDL